METFPNNPRFVSTQMVDAVLTKSRRGGGCHGLAATKSLGFHLWFVAVSHVRPAYPLRVSHGPSSSAGFPTRSCQASSCQKLDLKRGGGRHGLAATESLG